MIQRIQTLWLLLSAACGVLAFITPFWTYSGTGFTYQFGTLGVKLTEGFAQTLSISTLPVIVLLALHVILDFVIIYYYKNRQMQLKINSFNIFIVLIVIGTVFLWVPYMVKEKLMVGEKWEPGLIFPVISFIMLILANYFIKKDEKLVKSADRLR